MSNNSTTQKLQELFELYQSGALSKEEFDSLKSELLGLVGTSPSKGKVSSNLNDLQNVVPKSTYSLPNELKNNEQHSEFNKQSKVNLTKKKNKAFLLISSLVILVGVIAILFVIRKKSNEVTDIDGNIYKTVKIGSQVWMAENLKVTKYRNGDPISNVRDNNAWKTCATGAYCWYNNDKTVNKATYGALYNWYAVSDSRNIAPEGWHIASNDEWTTLTTYLGGVCKAAGYIKETDFIHWNSPNAGATNSSGFAALPGGARSYSRGSFDALGEIGVWWSNTESDSSNAWPRQLRSYTHCVECCSNDKHYGFSVRCIQN